MQIGTSGDLAQSYAMQSRNSALKHDIQRLTLELSSGQVADIRQAVGSNSAYVNDLERSLTKLEGYDLATKEAGMFAEGVQSALSRIGDLNSDFRDTLMTATNPAFGDTTQSILTQAGETLDSVINAMNTSVNGRMIFSGAATDTQPVAKTDDLLAALRTAIVGAGSVDNILTAAQNWFDDPAGYRNVGYLGSTTSLAPVSLSDQDSANFELRGDDPALRDTLRNLAIVSLAGDPALGLTNSQQTELFQKTVGEVLKSDGAVVDLQAKIGVSENLIEAIGVRHSTERSNLEMARNTLLSIDPYKAATELEQVQFQLQSLYAITSRMSQLSLVNFL
ncbi:flagellin [Sulfitobacter sp. F26169L]|uniref:flagellin N-terminal helical domain-containing protein n=1 Tax=Sulfitobacter sp. F26169L TaxID=2996015 RepID=UPI002260D242|nr:flagellin [Sulfitobacter sp. F26169L]MCX7565763.1 flagellin [Sulfitobacter sp. F26169L]